MPTTYLQLDPCLSPTNADRLLALLRDFGPFPMYVQDAPTEGIGAGLVRRHDALMNYVKARYAAGEAASMAELAARTNLFRGVLAEGAQVHVQDADDLLYRHTPFLEAARALSGLPLIVPDMLYANALLPGQELAVHTDTPEYLGLSKATVPEWLLVVMHHSGLFEDWRVRIAGGVTFLNPPDVGGAFVLYPEGADGPAERVGLRHNTSVMLDADALFHGVDRVGGPDCAAPPIRPGMTLHAVDADAWEVRDGDDVVVRYAPGEVRLSIQWKAHCFADEVARQRMESHDDDLTVDRVRSMLIADLQRRGLLGDTAPEGTELAMLLMNTYVAFPEA